MKVFRSIVALALFGAVVSAQAPDRSKPPANGPAPALKLPTIVKRQLANGLPAWIVELHEVPVVQVNLLVRAGTANDPPGKYGVASLAAAMLTEGAGSRSALEIADAVDFLGADLNASSGIDSSAVRLHVPVARLADALPIMADVALRPTFPAEELERQRQQRLTNLLQARDDPATIASLAFSRVLYGPEHRFGTAAMGTAATIKAFTPADLASFYRGAFRPDNRHVDRRRRHHARPRAAAARKKLRRVEGGAVDGGAGHDARGTAAGAAPDLPGRQARRATVADPDRHDRRGARDARLLPDSGDEHDPRRIVQLAAQPEPAREARLHVWGVVRLRHAAARRVPSPRKPEYRRTRRPNR